MVGKFVVLALLGSLSLGYSIKQYRNAEDCTDAPAAPVIAQVAPHVISIDLGTEIQGHLTYVSVYNVLVNAKEDDIIVFRLHSIGGNVDGLYFILNGLKVTKAHTVADLVTSNYSAAAVLACNTDEIIWHPFSFLMFHDVSVSGMESGKLGGLIAEYQNAQAMLKKALLPAVEKHILTEEQIDQILSGKDVYIQR